MTWYQQYRPLHLKDIVGNKDIVNIISTMLKSGCIPTALLISGPSGIGKTTLARIIARVLNCSTTHFNFEACMICPTCVKITNGEHADVLELDAASQNSVDDIRELISYTAYHPQESRFRIFIIDECHMLSKAAWTACLKILEDAPAYAKFIFVTTELSKVPDTIQGRCILLHLRAISNSDITAYLKTIANQNGLELSDDIIHHITYLGEGSIRASLNMLQTLSFFDTPEARAQYLRSTFGHVTANTFSVLINHMLAGDIKEVREVLDNIQYINLPWILNHTLDTFSLDNKDQLWKISLLARLIEGQETHINAWKIKCMNITHIFLNINTQEALTDSEGWYTLAHTLDKTTFIRLFDSFKKGVKIDFTYFKKYNSLLI